MSEAAAYRIAPVSVRSSSGAGARKTPLIARLAEWTVFAVFAFSSLPEVWTKPLRLGDVSVLNVLFCLCAGLAIAAGARAGIRNPAYLAAATAALVYMAILGRFRSTSVPFDEKVYFADMLTFIGLLAGYAWAGAIDIQRLARLMRWSAAATCLILAGTHLLLYAGILTPVWLGQRVFVWSVFSAIWWLTVIMPVLVATESPGGGGILSPKITRLLVMACLLTTCISSLLTGTRSVLLQVVICAVVCLRPLVKSFVHFYGVVCIAALLCLGLYAAAGSESWNVEFLTSRVQDTQLREEQRFLELQMMFEQLLPDIWNGQGFGAMFTSPVIVNNTPLAVAPHVAVLTTLFKGGVFTFAILIAAPAIVACWRVLLTRRHSIRYACWGAVLLYITGASMSGGWGFFHLFLFGLFLAMALRSGNYRRSQTSA